MSLPSPCPSKNGVLAATPNLPSHDLVRKRIQRDAYGRHAIRIVFPFSTINYVLADVSLISQLQGDLPQLKSLESRELSALQQLPPFHAIYFSSKKPILEDAKSEGGTRNVVVCLIFPGKLHPNAKPKLEKENAFHPTTSVIDIHISEVSQLDKAVFSFPMRISRARNI